MWWKRSLSILIILVSTLYTIPLCNGHGVGKHTHIAMSQGIHCAHEIYEDNSLQNRDLLSYDLERQSRSRQELSAIAKGTSDTHVHIFRNSSGHFADTPANRAALSDMVANSANFVCIDQYGTAWFAMILPSGEQLWATVRDGQIRNGGINEIPKSADPLTGLSSPTKPGK